MSENRFRAWYGTKPGRPLILAHRGDSYRGPENTLEAARLGFEAGADGWEFDVQMTGDGFPVVLHDESLLRTTDVARRFKGDPREGAGFLVGEFSLKEIRSLDAGSWFMDPSGGMRSAAGFGTLDQVADSVHLACSSGKVMIPTLAEALELTHRYDWLANVEIKSGGSDPGLVVETVLREIRLSGTLDVATVSSFDHEVVALVAAREPAVATGALVEGLLGGSATDLLRALGADALHAPASAVGPATQGVPVLVYTVNDAGPSGLAVRLIGEGVAGLFTDDPAALALLAGLNPS